MIVKVPARWLLCLPLLLLAAGCTEDTSPPTEIKTATNASIIIEPNICVGPIRAGMTVDQVNRVLGAPAHTLPNALDYPKLGLAIMPGADNIVQVVMCGDVMGIRGPYVQHFTWRTKEGIGMNSTREDLIKTYGDPTVQDKFRGGLESLAYQLLGITFTLEGGKVHHMIVRLGQPVAPSDSVKVNVVSPPDEKK